MLKLGKGSFVAEMILTDSSMIVFGKKINNIQPKKLLLFSIFLICIIIANLFLVCVCVCVCVQALHELGARKFALIGLNLLGCIPHEVTTHGKNGSICVENESKASLLFNQKLKALVDRNNKELSDAKFIFVNSAVISSDNPQISGKQSFLVAKSQLC